MGDPRFDLPLPDDPMERVRRLARDMAWGAINEKWGVAFEILMDYGKEIVDSLDLGQRDWLDYLTKTWSESKPPFQILAILGYLSRGNNRYVITARAFQLLEQPLPATFFISYMHKTSSAFALLIKARLQMLNPINDVFIDYAGIPIGTTESWEAFLEKAVKERDNFICLVTPESLDRPNIQKEIQWALGTNRNIVPIWHSGFTLPENLDALEDWRRKFLNINAIPVVEEKAAAYDSAIDRLVERFR